tara:strand:- start:78 stop:785 length:708 start_codon:yes stop_codon:yes gene_type:complete
MITFLVPTYNEKENVILFANSIKKLNLNFKYNILFVDDNSVDGTQEELKRIKNLFNNIDYIIRREEKRDLTQSLVIGFNNIKDKYIFVLDCDLQHDYKKIQLVFDTFIKEDCDLIIGSRFINNKKNIGLSKKRTLESMAGIYFCKLIGINNFSDPLSGFFLIKTSIVKKIKNKINTYGFKILLTILFLSNNKISVKEIPIEFKKRKFGYSKLDFKVRFLFLQQILKLFFYKLNKH